MKRNSNKNGFTLIELLAVIVILAIIALIATPVITGIVDSTKMSAFIQSGESIVSAIETECSTSILKNGNKNIAYYFDGDKPQDIKVKGKLPTSGGVMTDDKCHSSLNISDGTFCAVKSPNSYEVKGGRIIDGVCKLDYSSSSKSCSNGDINPGTFSESGTSDDPYLIKSIEDLYHMKLMTSAETEGKYFKLESDLDFKEDCSYADPSNKTFGDINNDGILATMKEEVNSGMGFTYPAVDGNHTIDFAYRFSGNLDGNNKVIRNLFINNADSYSGLFETAGSESGHQVFKNLSLENIDITSHYETGSLIGAYTSNTGSLTIDNINASGSIQTNDQFAGGLVGYISIKNAKSNINNSSFVGDIKCYSYCGGIVGTVSISGSNDASNVSNYSNLKSIVNMKGNNNVGGIAGNLGNAILNNLYSYGNIAPYSDYASYLGGIVGIYSMPLNSISSNLYNYANVGSDKEIQDDGGLFGNSATNAFSVSLEERGKITKSRNYGNVKSNREWSVTGGITGNGGNIIFDDVVNYGNVNGVNQTGGIGGNTNNVDCINCANYGNITGGSYTASIMSLGRDIINSVNYGNVTCNGQYDCGLISYFANNIKNTYSFGNLSITSVTDYDRVFAGGGFANTVESISNSFIKSDIISNYGAIGGLATKPNSITNSAFIGSITGNFTSQFDLVSQKNITPVNTYYSQLGGNITTGRGIPVPFSNITTAWFRDTLNLGDNFLYEDGYYPRVYKVDSNGNVTNELVEGQTKVAIR